MSDEVSPEWFKQLAGNSEETEAWPPPEPEPEPWYDQAGRELVPYEPPSDVELVATLPAQTLAMDGRSDLAFARMQMERAIAYTLDRQHADQERVTARAGVILAARWNSPEAEKIMGVRCATGQFHGERVGCRRCGEQFTAGVDGDYYEATTASDGLCFGCALADTRSDDAQVELTGVIVETPRTAASHTPSRRMPRTRRKGES